jgi:hypothetical protein
MGETNSLASIPHLVNELLSASRIYPVVSKRLGMPFLPWQDSDARYTTGPTGSWDCIFATFLMMNIDPASQDWAWAPTYWQTRVGSVLVLREDEQDLNLQDLALMACFAQCNLQDKLEWAMELDVPHRFRGRNSTRLSSLLGRTWRRNTRRHSDVHMTHPSRVFSTCDFISYTIV